MSRSTMGAIGLCLGLALPGTVEARGEVPPIVERSIEHHGGRLYESSEVSMTMCSASGCYGIVVWRRGGLYRHRVSGPVSTGQRSVEVTNRSVTLLTEEGAVAVTDATEMQRLRDWATARIYFAFLPYRLADPSVLYADLGEERWDERALHKVKVTFRSGSSSDADDEYIFWFDPESARLEQFAYSFRGDPGGLRFRRLLNYRRVGGILFFDQENLGIEGEGLDVGLLTPRFVADRLRPVSTIELDHIEVLPLEMDGGGDPSDGVSSAPPD